MASQMFDKAHGWFFGAIREAVPGYDPNREQYTLHIDTTKGLPPFWLEELEVVFLYDACGIEDEITFIPEWVEREESYAIAVLRLKDSEASHVLIETDRLPFLPVRATKLMRAGKSRTFDNRYYHDSCLPTSFSSNK